MTIVRERGPICKTSKMQINNWHRTEEMAKLLGGQADLETIMWNMGSEGGLEKPCGYGLFGAGLEDQGGAGLRSFSLRPPTDERLCEEALVSLYVQGGLHFCPGHQEGDSLPSLGKYKYFSFEGRAEALRQTASFSHGADYGSIVIRIT